MMPNIILLIRRKIKNRFLIATIILFVAFGLLVAKTATRPLDVELRIHIKICKKTEKGKWEVIDEVGPKNVNFRASLLELAKDRKVSSDVVIAATSKKGKPYKARLLGPAKIDYNPLTGRIQGEMIYEITYGKKTTSVPGKFTTDVQPSPVGDLHGKCAKGILGIDRTTVKVVSALTFAPVGESQPLILVSTEEYKLTPKK